MKYPIVVVCILFFAAFFSFSVSPGFSAEKDLELVHGPDMVMIESKGAMVRLFTLRDLDKTRAHQLKLSFFPKIADGALSVKFFSVEGTPLGKPVTMKEGRAALLDLDSGIDSIMVMLEENGMLDKKIRVFASMYRYPEGKGPKKVVSSKPPVKVPEKLVDSVDLQEESGLSKRELKTVLQSLSLSEDQARTLVTAFKNVRKHVGSGNFAGAAYFLKEAEKIYPCGEVYLQRSFIFGPVDVDMAIKNADKAIEYIQNGKTVSALLGKSESNPEARACVIAANAVMQKTFGKGRVPKEEEAKLKEQFISYIQKAEKLDSSSAKKAVDILKKQWETEEARVPEKNSPVAAGELSKNVSDFFQARELFVQKRLLEALEYIEKHPDMPEADSIYLKAEILLNLGRKEGARKALEKSVRYFEGGRCLAGKNGGAVSGTTGTVPPASVRAALARVSLARYWAEKFDGMKFQVERDEAATFIQTAIDYMDKAIEAVPAHREWQLLVNTYRTAKLKYLYP